MLATPYVFVDTVAFVESKFNLSGGKLRRLLDFARVDRIRILLPEVTRREIQSKGAEAISGAVSSWLSLRRNHPVMRSSAEASCRAVFNPPEADELANELAQGLDAFLSELRSARLQFPVGASERVFTRYFEEDPPFGPGKDKSEFPDAFAIDSIDQWCLAEEESAYVVSRDSAISEACRGNPRLIYLEDLDSLFELIEAHDARAEGLVESVHDEIARQIGEKFEWSGFYLESEDGEVESVTVEEVRILSYQLQEVVEQMVFCEAEAEVDYVAAFRYDDLSTATWDSEDRRYFVHHQVRGSRGFSSVVTAYVEVEAEAESLESVAGLFVHLDTSKDYAIDPHDGYGIYD